MLEQGISFLSFSSLVNKTFSFFKENFWYLIKVLFGGLLLGLLFGMIPVGVSALIAMGLRSISWLATVIGILGVILALFGALFGNFFIFVGIMYDKNYKFGDIFRKTKEKFWQFLGAFILVFLILGLASLVFVFPAIFLGVYLMFWPFIIIKEETKAIQSIKRNFQLIKNFYWGAFVRLLGFPLLIGIIALILGLIETFFFSIHSSVGYILGILILIILFAFNLITSILSLTFIRFTYENLKTVKENNPEVTYKTTGMEKAFIALIFIYILFIVITFLLGTSFFTQSIM